MTSLKQRAANRRNAQRSTGPKTNVGKGKAKINALKHGLSAPIELTSWAAQTNALEALLQSEGLYAATTHDLARKLIEFERNVDYQRQRFLDQVDGRPMSVLIPAEAQEELDAAVIVANLRAQGREAEVLGGLSKRDMRELQALFEKSAARQIRKANQDAAHELKNADRYLRRAANQLIKQLKSLGDD